MVRETRLSPDQLILPLFAVTGSGVERPIAALPGSPTSRPTCSPVRARAAFDAGIPAVLLFGIPDHKDAAATGAYADATASCKPQSARSKTPRRTWS